MLLVLYIC
ncbi:hypothetical protein Zm00014a_034265 [Zea mays]|uniref:Uncharacterized protein n=1 Tax=Zea mays TaxID=4577 RepID=A0A317Y5M1_MAIZE|nr:hypothetical protein Zm00014a_034265 [Zea mays]